MTTPELEMRLGRIEEKLDGIATSVARIEGAREAEHRWILFLASVISVAISGIVSFLRH